MGMPPDMELRFASVTEAVDAVPSWVSSTRKTLVLTGDVDSLVRLVRGAGIRRVNLGGVHHQANRRQRLRYLYLTDEEERALRCLSEVGVDVAAQDVPTAKPIPLNEIP